MANEELDKVLKEKELKVRELDVTTQELHAQMGMTKLDQVTAKQEMYRRAVEVTSVALQRFDGSLDKPPDMINSLKDLMTLSVKKLKESIQNLQ